MLKKPKILIPLTIQFSVRYIVRTGLLQRIQEYADPVIILGWEDPELTHELNESRVAVFQNPGKQMGIKYYRTRNKLSLWHSDHMQSPSTSIDRRRNALANPKFRNLKNFMRDSIFRLEMGVPGKVQKLWQFESDLLLTDTNFEKHLNLIKHLQPDLVFCLTPFFFEEELLLRAAHRLQIPLVTAILSFDNLTTKGWIPPIFAEYYLWNQYNHDELLRIYPETAQKVVKIVGAPQFDFYSAPAFSWSEEQWRQELGLPPEQPVILFGSTGKVVAPREEQWLLELDQAIDRGDLIKNPIILLRSHPVDSFSRWLPLQKVTRHVVYDLPWQLGKQVNGKTNVTNWDIQKLVSTLKYSAVHVNASSTMTIDGAIFNRPQIGPAYASDPRYDRCARDLYIREHYLPITQSGGLEIVYSRDELIAATNAALLHPEAKTEARKRMVREISTFDDGKATDRVNDALQGMINNLSIR